MSGHEGLAAPSAWVQRWAPMVKAGGSVLDLACGSGRHARLFAAAGHAVTAVDRDAAAIAALAALPGILALCADIESGPWPYAGRQFDAVVVTNYLHRPLFPALIDVVAPGGLLIYETFAVGNERHGRPSNPDFLLREGELLEQVSGVLGVVAYEHGRVTNPKLAVVQRLCARRPGDGDPVEMTISPVNS
jgi:SAM-dependent methyltransferase